MRHIKKISADNECKTSLTAMLTSIEIRYVIMLVEDILFSAKVDLENLREFVNHCVANKRSYLKIIQCYPLGQPSACSQHIGPIAEGVHYRIRIGAPRCEKVMLDRSLVFGMSDWNLETRNNVFDRVEHDRAFKI